MSKRRHKVLLIEGNGSVNFSLSMFAGNGDAAYDHLVTGSVSEMKEILGSQRPDVIITDTVLADGSVFDVLSNRADVPVIVVDGSGSAETAVKAMKAGAYDFLVRDRDGGYLKILPLSVENAITRRRYEEKIRLLESAVINANDAVIILEAEPGESRGRKILFVNEAFVRMTGYTFEEASGNTLRMLRGPKTDPAVLDRIRSALNSRSPIRVELVNYRKDGSDFWVECNIVPFADEKGEFIHWVSVQRDITERKRAEEERERLLQQIEAVNNDLTELNQELETIGAERTMSLMALTVADRIRNPATMIGARCRRIITKNSLSDELKGNILGIMEEAEKLDVIVREFETFLKSRRTKFNYADLNAIVDSVVQVVEKEASVKGIEISVDAALGPLNINMQKELLRVALYHVIRNAIEATSRGGSVSITTSNQENSVVLTVSDTGYGIAAEDIENVFKPFFSTKERGFGLGLPLVRQIISEHLGTVLIESAQNSGTTFKIVFPARWTEKKLN